MIRTLLKSKNHRATVTYCELHYEGSCAIDTDLLPNEQIHVWNINNGERFITYAVEAPAGSGIISLNGSAARRASVGDLVIIAAFGMMSDLEPGQFKPKLVFPDAQNRIVEVRSDAAGPQASKPDGRWHADPLCFQAPHLFGQHPPKCPIQTDRSIDAAHAACGHLSTVDRTTRMSVYRSERLACLPVAKMDGAARRIWSSSSGDSLRTTFDWREKRVARVGVEYMVASRNRGVERRTRRTAPGPRQGDIGPRLQPLAARPLACCSRARAGEPSSGGSGRSSCPTPWPSSPAPRLASRACASALDSR